MRSGVVINPHYKNMGNLYGSEYWTFVLPRRVGQERVEAVMDRACRWARRRHYGLALPMPCCPMGGRSFAWPCAIMPNGSPPIRHWIV